MKKLLLAAALMGSTVAVAVEDDKAVAILQPASGSQVKGIVAFVQRDDGVLVIADVVGLTPGKHGFHVHEKGDCSAPDASSAGGHFNPTADEHSGPEALHRHMGDLGNLMADSKGNAHYERLDKTLELIGPNSIIGKSVIVHEKEDDLTTQPTGNAGGRVACGIIKRIPAPKKG